jgi:hypothetical protein
MEESYDSVGFGVLQIFKQKKLQIQAALVIRGFGPKMSILLFVVWVFSGT